MIGEAQRLTIDAVMRELFPNGTRGGAATSDGSDDLWLRCPTWPPDLFGIVATIADRSGCYSEQGVVMSQDADERTRKKQAAADAVEIGTEWRTSGDVPTKAQTLWEILVASRHEHVCDAGVSAWKQAVMRLLAIADEASSGFGFVPQPDDDSLATVVFDDLLAFDKGEACRTCALPHSIASTISPDRLCIMPKALTPPLGCTLRSLSHNLALLPGKGVVSPRWFIGTADPRRAEASPVAGGTDPSGPETPVLVPKRAINDRLNILVIPFPYDLARTDFRVHREPEAGTTRVDGYFTLEQTWLNAGGERLHRDEIAHFVAELVRQAERDVGTVHAIVLPETALDDGLASGLIEDLANNFAELELVICGVLHQTLEGSFRNQALLARLGGGTLARSVVQNKHHRWKLDSRQIDQYQLGRQLDRDHGWWEAIDVSDRQIAFGVSSNDAVYAALICEDLARFDPVLPVLNSVGPNLVVALLMDGPQLQGRWPGRYATVLAEDPGSSVLSVTCLGMVKLARRHGEEVRRVIGLWKDSSTGASELLLPQGSLALTLSLKASSATQTTMDLRTDWGTTVRLTLVEVMPVSLSRPPAWLEKS